MESTQPEQGNWVVELNFAGCRIQRWARKRRHLLGLGTQAFALPRTAARHIAAI